MKKNTAIVAGAIVVLLAVGAVIGVILYNQLSKRSAYPVQKPAPAFTFTHVDGSEVSIENTNGKARLVYFYFSHCPNVCQPTNYLISQVQDKLQANGETGEHTALFSITFDPERDTTERLKEYAGKYNADLNHWYFLRGEVEYSREIAKEYGIAIQELDGGEDFAHTNAMILVDKEGNIRHYYLSKALEPDNAANIASDLMALAKE
ncbi:SCO family protein [Xylanibacillus composti]|uniref:Thioredoxin domain-containing protein n=1 Tax=Xylanibacillus composti TaxID=1572762 RepID=A0A8J4M2D8_9BACL|nr:SCO family protein [Xylanibacillus composti]MDT9723528.1 SCO family protein [Xylanibacillus composti]GIQ68436.1 hypothetical protein XYCOK13_12600 [Xylanibacillus composti]